MPNAITIDIVKHAKRVERGEVEAIPELWKAVFGTDIDPQTTIEEAGEMLQLGIERLSKGEPAVPEDDDNPYEDPGATVTLTDEELEAIAELRHLRVERKDIEDREKVLRNEILQRIGTGSRALTADGRPAAIKRKQIRRGVNRKKLEAEYPDVFDDVMTETEVTVLDLP